MSTTARLLSLAELEAGLGEIARSPRDAGTVEMIVCRPNRGERQVLDEGQLDLDQGLVGDNWKARGSWLHKGAPADINAQLTLMNVRAIAHIAQARDRWALAGDQLFVDLDLSFENLPPGTRLKIGSTTVEVTAEPHLGCGQFAARYGKDSVRFVNSEVGKKMRLRGLNARIIEPGTIRAGDSIVKA